MSNVKLDVASLSIDDQLKALKTKKSNMGKLFDIEISKLELQKNAVKSEQDEISSKEKGEKIRENMVRELMTDKSGKIPGQSVDQLIAVEPAAQGFPMIATE